MPTPIELAANGLLPPLPTAFLDGSDLKLLEPLTFVDGFAELPERRTEGRGALAAALATANAAYGHPRAAELADRLADPATHVIVTGQQPGLFGGPLYTLSKAVAASLWAERLEAAGQPAVAIFWVATEDHDFREVSRAVFPGPREILELDLGEDEAPLVPVGMRTLGPEVETALARLREASPGERGERWVDRLATWYRPDARFGEAFSRLLVALLGSRGPLVLDSMLPALKEASRPHLRRLVESRAAIASAFSERDARITSNGYDLQVTPIQDASPLFLLHGLERRRIEWRGEDRFGLRGLDGYEKSVDLLLETIEENPAAVSPGVMARTAVQDAVLGSSVLVFGPGEVSYIPQVAPLYSLLGIAPPMVHLRPQVLVLGEHQVEKLEALDVTLAELVSPELDLDRALAGDEAGELVDPVRERILAELQQLSQAALAMDSSLEGPWRKTSSQVERALEAFSGKVAAAIGRKNELAHRRAEDLRRACRPLEQLQERVVSTAHFPGKYGDRFVEAMFAGMELDPRRLHIVQP